MTLPDGVSREVQEAREPRDGCPCVNGAKPCDDQCSCAHPTMSAGCRRCCKYGSPDQRKALAEHLAMTQPQVGLSEHEYDDANGLCACGLACSESEHAEHLATAVAPPSDGEGGRAAPAVSQPAPDSTPSLPQPGHVVSSGFRFARPCIQCGRDHGHDKGCPHARHRCMRCGEEFDCPTPDTGTCANKYDVPPRIVGPDGVAYDHCPQTSLRQMEHELAGHDVAFFSGQPPHQLCVLCNDTFGWATADAEPISDEELPLVYAAWKAHPGFGLIAWVERKRTELAYEFKGAEKFKADNATALEAARNWLREEVRGEGDKEGSQHAELVKELRSAANRDRSYVVGSLTDLMERAATALEEGSTG